MVYSSIGRSNLKNGSGTIFLVDIPSPACAEMVFIAQRYFHKNRSPPRLTKNYANQGKIFVHHPCVCELISSKRIKLMTSTWAHFKEQTQLFEMSLN